MHFWAALCLYQRLKPPIQNAACKYLMLLQLVLGSSGKFSVWFEHSTLKATSYEDEYKEMAYELEIIPCAVKAHGPSSTHIVFFYEAFRADAHK